MRSAKSNVWAYSVCFGSPAPAMSIPFIVSPDLMQNTTFCYNSICQYYLCAEGSLEERSSFKSDTSMPRSDPFPQSGSCMHAGLCFPCSPHSECLNEPVTILEAILSVYSGSRQTSSLCIIRLDILGAEIFCQGARGIYSTYVGC